VRPRLVFLRPRNADNLVTIAETMARFGFVDWVVVSEAVHLETMRSVLRSHRAPNAFSDAVMNVRRVDSLRDAVSDCSFVVGTTMREFPRRERFTPRELSSLVSRRGDVTWALVFGAEANGMTNEDCEQCHALSFLPSSDEQPSLNLAQATLVYLYELSTQPSAPSGAEAVADYATLERLAATIEERLMRFGLARHRGDDPQSVETLLAPLIRAPLTRAEAALWSEAFRK
jgi:TrmH family RNA methyltransferase